MWRKLEAMRIRWFRKVLEEEFVKMIFFITIINICCFHVCILFCSFCTVLLMFSIINSTKYQEGDSSERITVWSLFGVGILMAMVAMVKIVRRFVLASSTTEIECLNHESVLMAGNNTSVARLSAAVEGDEDGDDGGALII